MGKTKFHALLRLLLVTTIGIHSIWLTAQIDAIGTCAYSTESKKYNIEITNLNTLSLYIIKIDGVTVTTLPTGDPFLTGEYLSDPIDFTDGTKTVTVELIANPLTTPDTTTLLVHEVLCVDVNQDDKFDFNTDICDFSKPLGTGGAIVSTVAPYNSDNVYLYVLTDSSGVFDSLSPVGNYSGLFEDLESGAYRVFAFNFLDTTDASNFLDNIPDSSDLDTYVEEGTICYMLCNSQNYVVDCQSIVDIYVDPVDFEVCLDGDAQFFIQDSFIIEPPANTTLSYQWEVDDGSGWTDINDGIPPDSVLDLFNLVLADSGELYRVIVTMNVDGSPVSMDTSGVGVLTIYDDPVFAANLDVTVNSDDPIGIVLSLDPESIPADSFELVSVTFAGLIADGGNASLGTTDDPNYISNDKYTNPTGGQNDTAFYEVVAISEHGCRGDTITIMAVIRPCPEVADLALTEVCSGDAIGLVLPTTDDNGITIDSFTITPSQGPGITGGPASSGTTTNVNYLSGDTFTNFTDQTDTVTYTITAFANDCESAPFEAKVAVHPEPVYADIEIDQCSDVAISVTLNFNDTSGLAIDSVDITAVVGTSLSGSATQGNGITNVNAIFADVFTNTTSLTDSVVYTITPYTEDCAGASYDITVRITTEPVGSDPAPVECSDNIFSIDLSTLITNGSTGLSFSWFAVDNPNVDGEETTVQTTSTLTDQVSNETGSSEDVIYKVVPTDGESCVGDTFNITVTILPEPVASDEALTVCSDETLDVVLTDNVTNGVALTGFTYFVTSSDSTGVPPGPSRTDTTLANITDTYNNKTNADVILTYVVTPIAESGCSGSSFDVDVTINPEPVLSASMDTTVCSDELIGLNLEVIGSSVAADSFRVVSITPDSSSLIAGGGNVSAPTTVGATSSNILAGDTWTNETASQLTVTYTVVAKTGACWGDEVDIIVSIDPTPVVELDAELTICSTEPVDLSTIGASITGGASDGTWSSNGSGMFDAVQFSTATTYTPSEADKDAGTIILTLTSDNPTGECGTVDNDITITILDVRCSEFPWNGNE